MNSKEHVAYLRGLVDFMPKEEKETKIYSAIVEALNAFAIDLEEQSKRIEQQREDYETLEEDLNDLQDSLFDLQEELESDADDYDESYEDFNSESDDDVDIDIGSASIAESYISASCPACSYSFYYKHEDGKDKENLVCPRCGEEFGRTI
ncbi:hypothetical protein FACS1894187_11380 [Synergistales bacterium]|nr:hypothetical protein FACS1894187_11380 [Synergistales bacterium]